MEKRLNCSYAAIQGSYWMVYAVVGSFASVFLLARGYSNSEIGVILAVANVVAVVLQPMVADFADRSRKVSLIGLIEMMAIGMLVLMAGLFVFQQKTLALSVIFLMLLAWHTSLQPLINSLNFRLEESGLKINFGVARSMGSLAYSILCAFMGTLVEKYSVSIMPLSGVIVILMLLARSAPVASALSAQIREGDFGKEYLAVCHGEAAPSGTLTDLLIRDKAERKTYVTHTPGKGVQEAVLDYERLGLSEGLSKLHILLRTGRTHQIRCQFSSRDLPLVGDRKYSLNEDGCPIALWSARLAFTHPVTGESMDFRLPPPAIWPWTLFE